MTVKMINKKALFFLSQKLRKSDITNQIKAKFISPFLCLLTRVPFALSLSTGLGVYPPPPPLYGKKTLHRKIPPRGKYGFSKLEHFIRVLLFSSFVEKC